MKKRPIHHKRNFDSMENEAIERLNRGKLTLAEYREIESDFLPLWNGETVTTIQTKVKEFFHMYGTHTEPAGIGWKLTYF